MAVDKGYGSGYKNTGLSKAAALKPGRLKKTAPAVAKARALKARNAAAAPSMARDKYSAKTVGALKGVAKGAIKVADYAFNGPKEAQKYSAYGFDSSFALPIGKLIEAAKGLRAAQGGLSSNTLAIGSRIRANQIGSTAARNIAEARALAKTASNSGPFPIGPVARMLPSMFRDSAKVAGGAARSGARRLFPQTERAAEEVARAARTRSNIMKRGR